MAYVGGLAWIAVGIGVVVAIGAGALLNYHFGIHDASVFGAMLLAWSGATVLLSCATAGVLYRKRR